VGLYKAPEVGL